MIISLFSQALWIGLYTSVLNCTVVPDLLDPIKEWADDPHYFIFQRSEWDITPDTSLSHTAPRTMHIEDP